MSTRATTLLPVALLCLLAVSACDGAAATTGETGTIAVTVLAGPICPVMRDPPDSGCDDRPVPGARILVQPADGRDIVVATIVTGDDGRGTVDVPPGTYLLVPQASEGLMSVPEPLQVVVVAGATASVDLGFDTGIR